MIKLFSEIKNSLKDSPDIEQKYKDTIKNFNKKIVVLDDDPTGIQTVNNVSVFTEWNYESILAGFEESHNLFYILTNSRSFDEEKTVSVHKIITENIYKASKATGKEFLIISRGDSTLRGHYPLETLTIKETLQNEFDIAVDGEVIVPFFYEGGRFTVNDIHYVRYEENLVPAGETEFASDNTFGFKNSDLKLWINEKSSKEENISSISVDDLRSLDFKKIDNILNASKDFSKIIVNAFDENDLKIFTIAFLKSLETKNFLVRSAASFVKIIGGIKNIPLLEKKDIVKEEKNGGLIIIGSHVDKTNRQLEKLKELDILFYEFDYEKIFSDKEKLILETKKYIEENISCGKTVAVFTKRKPLDKDLSKDEKLKISVEISESVTEVVRELNIKPRFIIAKGGITSSDVGTKGLLVKKATVQGQIIPGVPVWLLGSESKFPNMSYIIFPGNVGEDDSLKKIVERLI